MVVVQFPLDSSRILSSRQRVHASNSVPSSALESPYSLTGSTMDIDSYDHVGVEKNGTTTNLNSSLTPVEYQVTSTCYLPA